MTDNTIVVLTLLVFLGGMFVGAVIGYSKGRREGKCDQ
jgi:membrane protein DedA with SNARE-associated domain